MAIQVATTTVDVNVTGHALRVIALEHAVALGTAAVAEREVTAADLIAVATEFETYLKGGDQK